MSFSDRPSVSRKRKLGCFAYAIVSFLVVSFALLMATLGHNECSYEPDAPGCEWDEIRRLLLFPGSLIVAAIGAMFVARWAAKDDN